MYYINIFNILCSYSKSNSDLIIFDIVSYILISFTSKHFGAIFYLPKTITMVLVRELKQIGKYLARKVINSKFKSKNTIFIELTKRFEK